VGVLVPDYAGPSREERYRGYKLPRARDFWESPSLKNIMYTRMRHVKKQNSKKFSSDGPRENVVPGPRDGSRRHLGYALQLTIKAAT